eukprot:CAMPEP_0119035254 /NCGR_PEP_ID=MMETSP1177-20130426/2186_1 /TAXON_ID=2985 /ORGANISM="Ochromonas sp, Strain CCMP1899" /LENGTH=700 /DNA_ID=CAMNT_0006993251 /DNA_START=140 /DNA_END=2239 /DNA_ORIENTATION=+
MGVFLSTPCKLVDAEEGSGNKLQYAVGEMQGWRKHMEDAHIAYLDLSVEQLKLSNTRKEFVEGMALFGVFDGHGGKEVSLFVKDFYARELLLLDTFDEFNIKKALIASFHHIDAMLNNPVYEGILREYKKRPNPSERIASRVETPIEPLGRISPVNYTHSAQYLEDNPIVDGVTFLNRTNEPDIYDAQALKSELIISSDKETIIVDNIDKTGAKIKNINAHNDKVNDMKYREIRTEIQTNKELEEYEIFNEKVIKKSDKREEEEERKYFDDVYDANTNVDAFVRNISNDNDNNDNNDNNDEDDNTSKFTSKYEVIENYDDNKSNGMYVSTEIDFTESITSNPMVKEPECPMSPSLRPLPIKSIKASSLSFSSPSYPISMNSSLKNKYNFKNNNMYISKSVSSIDEINEQEKKFKNFQPNQHIFDALKEVNEYDRITKINDIDTKNSDNNTKNSDDYTKNSEIDTINNNIVNDSPEKHETSEEDEKRKEDEITQMIQGIISKSNNEIKDANTGYNQTDSFIDNNVNVSTMSAAATTYGNNGATVREDNEDVGSKPFRGVRGQPASILSGGSLICNLPQHKVTAGCTAIVTLITGNTLYVANAGDSRGVLCRKGGLAYPLSEDHKPSQDRESARISAAGGFINHVGRINGNLNLSRSLGDLKYKQVEDIPPEEQMITAEPDVTITPLEPTDEFLVLGCDGIW